MDNVASRQAALGLTHCHYKESFQTSEFQSYSDRRLILVCLQNMMFTVVSYSAPFNALVVKASGLAAGKGVIVASDKDEACKAVHDMLNVRNKFIKKN